MTIKTSTTVTHTVTSAWSTDSKHVLSVAKDLDDYDEETQKKLEKIIKDFLDEFSRALPKA